MTAGLATTAFTAAIPAKAAANAMIIARKGITKHPPAATSLPELFATLMTKTSVRTISAMARENARRSITRTPVRTEMNAP